jgi:hypothetical protein
MQARKREVDIRDPALLAANPALSEPIKIPGLQYVDIRITGKNFEHHLLSQLGWISYLYVGGAYTSEAVPCLAFIFLPLSNRRPPSCSRAKPPSLTRTP